MPQIKIKRVKSKLNKEQSRKMKEELRADKHSKCKTKKGFGFFAVHTVALIAILALGGYCYFFQNTSPFEELRSDQEISFTVFDHEEVLNQALNQKSFAEGHLPYLYYSAGKINSYFPNNDLKEILSSIFKKNAALMLFPADDDTSFPFVIAFEKKTVLENQAMTGLLTKFNDSLASDYGISKESYRQIDIIEFDYLRSSKEGTLRFGAYVELNGYFLISNSKDVLKSIIDNVLGR